MLKCLAKILPGVFFTILFASCFNDFHSFQGGGGSKEKKEVPPIGVGPGQQAGGQEQIVATDVPVVAVEVSQDNATVDCAVDDMDDADEIFNFNSNGEIRAFLNQKCGTGIPVEWKNQGAVRADAITAQKVCYYKGYKHSGSYQTQSFTSPHDNHIAWWDEGQKKFLIKYDASAHNYWMRSLQCEGKMKEPCSGEATKVDCSQI